MWLTSESRCLERLGRSGELVDVTVFRRSDPSLLGIDVDENTGRSYGMEMQKIPTHSAIQSISVCGLRASRIVGRTIGDSK